MLVGVLLNAWAVRSDEARQCVSVRSTTTSAMRDAIEMAEWAAGPTGKEFMRRQAVAAWQARLRLLRLGTSGADRAATQTESSSRFSPKKVIHVKKILRWTLIVLVGTLDGALDRQRDFRVA